MRFRTVAIAAVVLVLAATAGLAAYQVADEARSEAAQQTIERNDSLAVNSGIRQKLVSDADHDPTAYGDNGTERVEYSGTVWTPPGNYTYYPDDGEIEFLRDEPDPANISYEYQIPADQTADDQLKVLSRGTSRLALLAVGLAFVVLLLFVGGFFARRMGMLGGRSTRGR